MVVHAIGARNSKRRLGDSIDAYVSFLSSCNLKCTEVAKEAANELSFAIDS